MTAVHLPNELLELIIDAVPLEDTRSLAVWLQVCRATYALAGPRLYADLSITDTNLPSVLRGLVDDRQVRNGPPLSYPSPESNARKRQLLAYTTTLRVRSVPEPDSDEDTQIYTICPMDKATFPAVKTVLVHVQVPHHTVLSEAKSSERSRTISPGSSA
jgi:hypothetical protein